MRYIGRHYEILPVSSSAILFCLEGVGAFSLSLSLGRRRVTARPPALLPLIITLHLPRCRFRDDVASLFSRRILGCLLLRC